MPPYPHQPKAATKSPISTANRPQPKQRGVSAGVVKTAASPPRFASLPIDQHHTDPTVDGIEPLATHTDSMASAEYAPGPDDILMLHGEESQVIDTIEDHTPITNTVPRARISPKRDEHERRMPSTRSRSPEYNDAPLDIDDNLRKCLRKCSGKKAQTGLVYIQQVEGEIGLYKVGCTSRTAADRRNEIKYSCGFQLKVRYRSNIHIELFKHAERLVQTELGFFREPFICPRCELQHEEYFRLPLRTIEDVVLRWERFLKQQPYHSNGNLHEFWQKRLNSHPIPPEGEKHHQHVQRGERWSTFVNASDLEQFLFTLVSWWKWLHVTGFWNFDIWRTPLLYIWAASLFVTWLDNGFTGNYVSLRILLEVLQVGPLFMISPKAPISKSRTTQGRSGS
jgi:hypothetical protein